MLCQTPTHALEDWPNASWRSFRLPSNVIYLLCTGCMERLVDMGQPTTDFVALRSRA